MSKSDRSLPPTRKEPVKLRPRAEHERERLLEILQAMYMHLSDKANGPVPSEWLIEFNSLASSVSTKYTPDTDVIEQNITKFRKFGYNEKHLSPFDRYDSGRPINDDRSILGPLTADTADSRIVLVTSHQ